MLIAGIPWWATDLNLVIGCGPDAIPGGGTKIPQAARHSQPRGGVGVGGKLIAYIVSISLFFLKSRMLLFCQGNSSALIHDGASQKQDKRVIQGLRWVTF